ncbi:hypothetical protein HDU96_011077 [Phlyctochytrium bullatum]|nr:hypothetical protein HDU96_011077 [Phlyctochytrium bullatum]
MTRLRNSIKFDPYIWSGYIIYLFAINYLVQTRALSTAVISWDRERIWRSTFILEKYIAEVEASSSETAKGSGTDVGSTDKEMVGVENSARKTITRFRRWRQEGLLFNVRLNLAIMAVSDAARPYLDMISFCNRSQYITVSPSLCSEPVGSVIRTIHHSTLYIVAMLFAACGVRNLAHVFHICIAIPIVIVALYVYGSTGEILTANNMLISCACTVAASVVDGKLERRFFKARERALGNNVEDAG